MSIPPPPPPGGGYGPPPPMGPPGGGYGPPPPMGPPPPGGNPYGAPPPRNDNAKTLGIISLVAGVIGIPAACCCWFIGWIPALVAVATGGIGLAQIKDDPTTDAKPFLIAGLVLGILAVLMTIFSAVFGVASSLMDGTDFS